MQNFQSGCCSCSTAVHCSVRQQLGPGNGDYFIPSAEWVMTFKYPQKKNFQLELNNKQINTSNGSEVKQEGCLMTFKYEELKVQSNIKSQ